MHDTFTDLLRLACAADTPASRGIIGSRQPSARLLVTTQTLETGNTLDLGREQRLFAARDGGCLVPGCDRPPSWWEAHHIDHWHRDHGQTNLGRGVLLCRHHHMLVHNNGWEIARDQAGTSSLSDSALSDSAVSSRAAQ